MRRERERDKEARVMRDVGARSVTGNAGESGQTVMRCECEGSW